MVVKSNEDVIERYLELLKRTLTRYQLESYGTVEPVALRWGKKTFKQSLLSSLNSLLRHKRLELAWHVTPDDLSRFEGEDWPVNAETMIGMRRMNQLHESLDVIRRERVSGDLMETEVWRGGASIFMAAYNLVWGLEKRVFVIDSFKGLPPNEPTPQTFKLSGITFLI